MPYQLLSSLRSEAVHSFVRGKRSFKLFGLVFTIEYQHHNEYGVMLPGNGGEVVRLYDRGCGNVSAEFV